jgi:hypothetical protein
MIKYKKIYISFILILSLIVTVSISSKSLAPSGKILKLKANSKIYSGTEIKTGNNTRVIIKFLDNSELRIAQKSKIKIEKAIVKTPENREISAKLILGKLWAKVSKSKNKNKNFVIKTDTATAGVRGTSFSVSFKDDKSSIVSLYTGIVDVEARPKNTNKNMKNYDKRKRKEVSGPKEVTLKKWNKIVLNQMQRVIVAEDGEMETFDMNIEEEQKDEWIAWNSLLDKDLEK